MTLLECTNIILDCREVDLIVKIKETRKFLITWWATYHPQNLLSLFHSDSPWRIMTILYLPDIVRRWWGPENKFCESYELRARVKLREISGSDWSSTFIRPYLSENVRQQTELLAKLWKPLESCEGDAKGELGTTKKWKAILNLPLLILIVLLFLNLLGCNFSKNTITSCYKWFKKTKGSWLC